MPQPITAGDRLVPQASPTPPGAPEPGRPRQRPGKPKARRRGNIVLRFFGWVAGALLGLALVGGITGGLFAIAAWNRYTADLPTVDGLQHYQPKLMSRIYAGNSQLIAELATERRIFVPITAIPDLVKQAFISAEDQNFWKHNGVDFLAIARAGVTDLLQYGNGRRPIGASTITQQVAKNMLLGSNEVSMARKVKEIALAMRIEQALPKDRILELYLNEIYFGLQSYGVAAAAQAYFNKSLDDLTIPEAAFLAALPKAPNNYNPFRFPEAARDRRDFVITRMMEDHAITPEQASAAKASPIVPAAWHRPEVPPGTDWFGEEVRRILIDHFGAEATTQGGLTVRTSLSPSLQAAADKALRDGLLAYDRSHGYWRGPVTHVDASTALRTRWNTDLAGIARPPGMLPDWRLAIVLESGAGNAALGYLQRPLGATNDATATPRVLPMLLADSTWARSKGPGPGRIGAAPRRMSDILHPGDVVMVEPTPEVKPQGRTPGQPERLLLRQIPEVSGALVSLDPATGRVLAIAGGWSFEMSQFDRATQALRQPGSSFKPMVYLTALERGISPSQRFLDAPFVLDQGAAGVWRPGNYEGTFNGPTPLRVALEQSLNLVTVRVAEQIGMESVAQNAIAFHVVDNMPRVLPAALGAVETTVLRQAGAYAGLAMGGREVIPSFIDSVQDRNGQVVWRPNQAMACAVCNDPAQPPQLTDTRAQIADPQSVFQLITMMQGVTTRGTGVKAVAGLNRPVAGKTGTTQDFNDAWFVGFTPDLVTAVWVGYDTPQSLGENETGGNTAAPIWHDYMTVALANRPKLNFVMPEGLFMASWDSGSGMVTDAFKPNQVPGASSASIGADSAAANAAPAAPGSGIDSGMGGLY